MLKQNARVLNAAKVLFDGLLVCAAFFISWSLKFTLSIVPDVGHLPFSEYAKLLILGVPCFLLMQYFAGLYKPQRTLSVAKEVRYLALNSAALFLIILSYLFVFKIY
ncbi:MAG: hypothetical protein IJN39_02945, partial [Clostridia bacterium]|nr:hypothetical protein [Clostridia bacterium]